MSNLYFYIYFGSPVVLILLLVYSIFRYRKVKKAAISDPGGENEALRKRWKMIVSILAVITTVVTVAVVGFIVLVFFAIAFM